MHRSNRTSQRSLAPAGTFRVPVMVMFTVLHCRAARVALGGARSYTAIAEFASELDAATLARLGTWRRPYSDCWIPPSEATLRRTLQQVDADALDRLVGDWLADQQPPAQAGDQPAAVAVDGKALRGAVGPDGQQ